MKLLYSLLFMYFSIISLQAIEYYEEDDAYEYTNNYIDRSRDFCSESFANPVNEYEVEYKTTCENAFDITNTVESYYLNHDVVYKNRICSQVDSETNSGDSVVFLTYQKTLLCRYECSSSVVCAAGLVKDPNTCECVPPPCNPTDTLLSGISQSMCVGTMGYDDAWYADLYWACDGTCRGVLLRYYDCDELEPYYSVLCDITKNDFNWACTNSSSTTVPPDTSKTTCTPRKNPCDTLYNSVVSQCDLNTSRVDGYPDCTHNGIDVTNNTIKCVLDVPPPLTASDCQYDWYSVFNSVTATCDCIDGYTRNSWDECWKDLDSNATSEEIAADQLAQDESGQTSLEKEIDANATIASATQDSITNDTLSGIRTDLNSTNDILDSMSSKLDLPENTNLEYDDLESELKASSDWIEIVKGEYVDFADNVEIQLSTIESQFETTQALFSGVQSFSVPSGDTSGCISFYFHGKLIEIDLCTPFLQFQSVVYFIMTLILMVGTFKFMATHLLKGLE